MAAPAATAPAPPPAPSPSDPATRGYRPHLDGVRAVAVAMVILFHLGYAWIPGGFVGVDVFFVLSGYLITGLLVGEATGRGTVGLGRFYARRARRLLPASIAVLAAVMVAGHHLFDPVQKQALGWDTTFAAFYSANWRAALAGGDYFAPGDVPSPLVHYWSLAVEEQFYLVWPALFLGLYRLSTRGRARDAVGRLLAAVLVLAVASAVASVALAGSSLTYYGTHTRAYQLLAGAALALAARHRGWAFPDTRAGRGAAGVSAVAALAALAALAHRVTDASAYPGWPGLAVTGASLALIAGVDLAPPGPVARLVGHRSLAAVGRLSYSLYIWHWPVIVFLPLVAARPEVDRPGLAERPALVAVTGALALVSYLVVERPVRFRLAGAARPAAVVGTGLALSLVAGAVAYPLFQPRDDWDQAALVAVRDLAEPGRCPYFEEDWPSPAGSEPCVHRDGDGPVVALVGDSHAQQWQPALEELAEGSDARIVRATRGGCPANDVVAYALQPDGRRVTDTACAEWRHHVYRDLVERFAPDVVIVATRSHVRGLVSGGRDVHPTDPAHLGLWREGWDWTLRTLSAGGARVVVSETIPTLPERVPACLIRRGQAGRHACDFPVAADAVVPRYNTALREAVAAVPAAGVIDPTPIGCPGGTCPALLDGVIVHRDDNHLSARFVRHRAGAFAALLRTAGARL
ncbi:MAG TPA: acyltransferase family protein [Acidimicrobiales bacterium]|nr:acyltransferase family protein [Acidimicrobiales bacterium]